LQNSEKQSKKVKEKVDGIANEGSLIVFDANKLIFLYEVALAKN